jgi:nucleotide-binding universal stress UspA family protein
MFNDVIVGVDQRDGGREAIALARLFVAEGGELTLAYVYRGDPYVWRGSSPPYEASESERVRELLEEARDEAGIDAQIRWRGSSGVGRGLHELAEEVGADLLVVGSSRRGLLGRVLLGDDTRAALNGAPCAVAIAPAGFAPHAAGIREIGVGYNESPESEQALEVARKLAAEHGARVSALETIAIPEYVLAAGPAAPEDALESVVEDARARIAALGDVEPHAVYGHPAEELALYSASTDLLVVGSRSYGPIGRLIHGSTSQRLARTARCPLLVLTRAARAAETARTGAAGHAANAAVGS